jgi:hypothetical protein
MTTETDYSPYCPMCGGCGEEGCCSPLMCSQDPCGDYCKSYLQDLKFGYAMHRWFANNLYDKLSQDQKKEYDDQWNLEYDERYRRNDKQSEPSQEPA